MYVLRAVSTGKILCFMDTSVVTLINVLFSIVSVLCFVLVFVLIISCVCLCFF